MIQLHFGLSQRVLYGVYHPAATPRLRRGALILNPYGWESIRAHRSLRTLASRLADGGIDVLRFDYSGSGDSFGEVQDVTLPQWIEDADLALEELLATAGLEHVALIGMRLGALIAAEISLRRGREVDRLVLWEPPVNGSEVVAWADSAPSAESLALPMSPTLVSGLEEFEMSSLEAFRRMALVVSSDPAKIELPQAQAVNSIATLDDDPKPWVEDRHHGAGAVPTVLVAQIADWLTS